MWLPHERSMLRMLRCHLQLMANASVVSRQGARPAAPVLRRLPFGVADYGGHL